MSLLHLDDVALTRGGTHVLGGVALHVDEGEFVSILGPSGAGKSTLFELLIGGLAPDAGEIAFAGRPIDRGVSPFAFMPQRDTLMPWRIIDNVTPRPRGAGPVPPRRRAARERVRPLFPFFGLKGFVASGVAEFGVLSSLSFYTRPPESPKRCPYVAPI